MFALLSFHLQNFDSVSSDVYTIIFNSIQFYSTLFNQFDFRLLQLAAYVGTYKQTFPLTKFTIKSHQTHTITHFNIARRVISSQILLRPIRNAIIRNIFAWISHASTAIFNSTILPVLINFAPNSLKLSSFACNVVVFTVVKYARAFFIIFEYCLENSSICLMSSNRQYLYIFVFIFACFH